MDKYYTPEIEEFHVGFEYDWYDDYFGWKPHKIDHDNLSIILKELYNGDEFISFFRVKHLDRDDIKDLGWDFVIIDMLAPTTEYYTRPYKEVYTWEMTFNKQTNHVLIYTSANEDDHRFYGKIKNKSELKKLMQQLEIYE